ncbi:hypothetical protein [uncultured Cohaesibacter sp.]|nr:hypothetical protein [uncultured Cohaesibacter sp.]
MINQGKKQGNGIVPEAAQTRGSLTGNNTTIAQSGATKRQVPHE